MLASAQPLLVEGKFVFVLVDREERALELAAVCCFREAEGVTAICPREKAEAAGLPYSGTYRQITLKVYSALNAVGFLAAIAGALASAGIPCNAVSAYYHDHLFVPSERGEEAVRVIGRLSGGVGK